MDGIVGAYLIALGFTASALLILDMTRAAIAAWMAER